MNTKPYQAKKALERILKTFTRFKDKLYEDDINALKTLSNYFNDTQEQVVLNNIAFIKAISLLMFHYTQHDKSAKQGVFSLEKDLTLGLPIHIERLKSMINTVNNNEYFECLGLHDKIKEPEQRKIIEEKHKEIIEQMNKEFNYESVQKRLYEMCNNFQFNDKINDNL